MKSFAATAALCAALFIAPAAQADDGDDNAFVLVNKSTVDAIQFFTKRKDGSWSKDWLKMPVKPAATRPLKFSKATNVARCRPASSFPTAVNLTARSIIAA